MGAPEPVLRVRDLAVSFASEHGTIDAVRGASFDVRPGRTLVIAGESGSGKSVTSTAVMGLLPETATVSGSVALEGRELLGLSDHAMSGVRGNEIAMIFQDPMTSLSPVYTIGQQISETLEAHQRLNQRQLRGRGAELLELVGIPDPGKRLNTYPHELSGGMRQRVMIAIAIANNPKLIIADEPTTALDVTIQAQVLDVLLKAQPETNAAIMLITHDLGVVARVADDVLVMYAGRPVEVGTVDDVFYRPRMPYSMGLLAAVPRSDRRLAGPLVPIEGSPPSMIDLPPGCPFAPRCPIAVEACTHAEPDLVALPDGRSHLAACVRGEEIAGRDLTYQDVFPPPEGVRSMYEGIARQDRAPVLAVEGLTRHFTLRSGITRRYRGTVKAVDGISFDLREGETLALVGESGCGKSTTLLELMQLKPPVGGSVEVFGQDVVALGRSERRSMRRGLQIVFQDPMGSLDPRATVFDILAEPMNAHGVARPKIVERVRELLELVGLDQVHADRFPSQFSGGQLQRICIARALALEPQLVVLDEPVASLDVSIQAGVVNLLEDIQARLGVAFLFVTHDLAVVRHIADRVAVMYLGRIVEIGEVEQVFTAPAHPYTRALISAAPVPDPTIERERDRVLLTGDLPSPSQQITGCRFRTRCPRYMTLAEDQQSLCRTTEPDLTVPGPDDHRYACHYPEVAAQPDP